MMIRRLLTHVLAAGLLLSTAAPAFADTLVKVECNGNCASISLGAACGGFGFPQAISCDGIASPGAGFPRFCGQATCIPFGALAQGDLVSHYCNDTQDNDIILHCF